MDRQNWIGRLERIERIRKCIGAKRLTDPHDTDGTCLRGTVKCNYDELLTAFGEPVLEGLDGNRCRMEHPIPRRHHFHHL